MSLRTYRVTVGALLAAQATLLTWNAWRFDWLRGYDAFADDLYATVVSSDLRLPGVVETGVWHTPPLWFALAGGLRRLASATGLDPVQRPGQLLAAAAGLAICVLTLLLARTLWPERRGLHLLALVFTASSPALVRASAMYHPETLATALAAGGLLVAVRALAGGRPTLLAGAGAGALLGLGALTRAWGLAVLAAVVLVLVLDAWRHSRWGPALALVLVSSLLVGPWLVNEQVAHGSALAFNRDAPSTSVLDRRPASFYLGPHALAVFRSPVAPDFRNELVPHLYADWWGDWALTWDTSPPPAPGQLLDDGVVSARVRQSYLGVLPTLLALAGLAALGFLAIARRSAALAVLPLAALAVLTAYVAFAVRYPSTDGDTIKGTYLLSVLPVAAVGAAFVIDAGRPAGRWWAVSVAVAVAALVAAELPFLVL